MAQKLSKKRPPNVGNAELQRIIRDIYDHINHVVDAVNQPNQAPPQEGEGKIGDIRVVESAKGVFHFQVRTSKGWASTPEGILKLVPKKDTQPS